MIRKQMLAARVLMVQLVTILDLVDILKIGLETLENWRRNPKIKLVQARTTPNHVCKRRI
jgi:hypothetical protein